MAVPAAPPVSLETALPEATPALPIAHPMSPSTLTPALSPQLTLQPSPHAKPPPAILTPAPPLPKRYRNVVWRPLQSQQQSIPRPMPCRTRFFLNVFSGHSASLTAAARKLEVPCLTSFDKDGNKLHDILDDQQFAFLLQLCWSGRVALAWFAPPCRLYSRLRFRPGGPKALRKREFMEGVPGRRPWELQQVTDSNAIHSRLLRRCQHWRHFRLGTTAALQHGLA